MCKKMRRLPELGVTEPAGEDITAGFLCNRIKVGSVQSVRGLKQYSPHAFYTHNTCGDKERQALYQALAADGGYDILIQYGSVSDTVRGSARVMIAGQMPEAAPTVEESKQAR